MQKKGEKVCPIVCETHICGINQSPKEHRPMASKRTAKKRLRNYRNEYLRLMQDFEPVFQPPIGGHQMGYGFFNAPPQPFRVLFYLPILNLEPMKLPNA
jgi:hypothetical protein